MVRGRRRRRIQAVVLLPRGRYEENQAWPRAEIQVRLDAGELEVIRVIRMSTTGQFKINIVNNMCVN